MKTKVMLCLLIGLLVSSFANRSVAQVPVNQDKIAIPAAIPQHADHSNQQSTAPVPWWIIPIYVIAIIILAGFPEILDILMAYRSKNKAQDISKRLIEYKLGIDKESGKGLSSTQGLSRIKTLGKLEFDELREFIKESEKSPPGIQGLTRGIIAVTVIVVLGIAVFHILVYGIPENDSPIINNILSMFAGLLAAITGFYFGVRQAEEKVKTKTD